MPATTNATIRPMTEGDVAEADRIMRQAFGTFLGLPDPMKFGGDSSFIAHRMRTDPEAAFVAEVDGEVVGSNLATRWGSFGFFGPLSVRPDYWGKGVARALLDPVMERFRRWELTASGLFTFAHSPKHVGLYGSYGFAPRFLTPLMMKPVAFGKAAGANGGDGGPAYELYSAVEGTEAEAFVAACRSVAESVFGGLDLTMEIEAIREHGLGDTVLVRDDRGEPAAFACCHIGKGTEAGSGICYVKFAAARAENGNGAAGRPANGGGVASGVGFGGAMPAPASFTRLLNALDAFAMSRGAAQLMAGVNTARAAAYSEMQRQGYRTMMIGIAMHGQNAPAFSHPGAFVLDDWR